MLKKMMEKINKQIEQTGFCIFFNRVITKDGDFYTLFGENTNVDFSLSELEQYVQDVVMSNIV